MVRNAAKKLETPSTADDLYSWAVGQAELFAPAGS
jgi:hypothetical protein